MPICKLPPRLLFHSLILLLSSTLLTGCSSLQQEHTVTDRLSPVTENTTHQYHPGKFIWHDLLTPDAEAAKKFYGALLGWNFKDLEGYIEIHHNHHLIGGILQVTPEKDEKEALATWLPSLSVEDIDAKVQWVTANGGKTLKGPLDMPQRGRGALISDPQGARLVILRTPQGDPMDRQARMGDWLWNEIWSPTPDQLKVFYQGLGGYQSTIETPDYIILVRDGQWRAGIRRVSDDSHPPIWIPVVRVENPEQLLDQVETLGGVVWVRPGETPDNKDTALISDNTGALLMLQRWNYDSNRKEK